MITKIAKLFVKKKPTFFEKAKSTASSYSATAKAKGMDAMGKIQKSKIYTEASKSVSELKAPLKKYGNIDLVIDFERVEGIRSESYQFSHSIIVFDDAELTSGYTLDDKFNAIIETNLTYNF